MTAFELLSILMSLLAVIISGITAYETFFVNFKTEVLLRPRVILTGINGKPVIVLGCDLFNKGSKSGSIEDLIVTVKYRQENPKIIERYIFLPVLSRDDYNINRIYREIDFEPFQSISLPAKSRLVKYVVFTPSNENFLPLVGEADIKLFFRSFKGTEWQKALNKLGLKIEKNNVNAWSDPQGKTVMLETSEHDNNREKFMENAFR